MAGHCAKWAALFLFLIGSGTAANAATITIINGDGAGEGFNDPTAAAPVGGNPGTTLGAQRLNAFQFAADKWGARLVSNVTIQINAQFNPLSCTTNSATLGSAGPAFANRDFPGAPVASTWYHGALANAIAGSDANGSSAEINATFNTNLGQTNCLTAAPWYFGLDASPPGQQIDFVSVLIHELGHGLGFSTLVTLGTGAKFNGFNDAYMLNLENHGATPSDYPSMTDAQRVAASISTGNLHWIGSNVRAASGVLSAGKVGDHVRMFAPNPAQGGSSVSHWDTALTPNQVMEPSYTQPLHVFALELELFKDIGWGVVPGGGGGGGGSVKAHDFNGDGKSDILWRNTSGEAGMWMMNGGSIASTPSLGVVPNTWSVVGQRDFSATPDAKSDLLWLNTAGDIGIWFMNGGTTLSLAGLGNVGTTWSVVGTGDFNGDGKADILWRSTSGDVGIWFMNGGAVLSTAALGNPGTSWSVVGTGDFDGDGKRDILWRSTSHDVGIWFMNGGTITSTAALGNVGPTWLVAGTGDFDGAGKTDILWRSTSNEVGIWFMNGASVTPVGLGNVGPTWYVASVGDYDGNSKADILWRSLSHDIGIWFMNGGTLVSTAGLGNVGSSWLVQNAASN